MNYPKTFSLGRAVFPDSRATQPPTMLDVANQRTRKTNGGRALSPKKVSSAVLYRSAPHPPPLPQTALGYTPVCQQQPQRTYSLQYGRYPVFVTQPPPLPYPQPHQPKQQFQCVCQPLQQPVTKYDNQFQIILCPTEYFLPQRQQFQCGGPTMFFPPQPQTPQQQHPQCAHQPQQK